MSMNSALLVRRILVFAVALAFSSATFAGNGKNAIFVTPQQFGAKADGKTDDTRAIAKAIAKADETCGVVLFPAGTYRTDEILLPSEITLKCDPSWSYKGLGRVVLVPAREDQRCLSLIHI